MACCNGENLLVAHDRGFVGSGGFLFQFWISDFPFGCGQRPR